MAEFEVPKRINGKWLDDHCPKLSVTQARALVKALRARGWPHGVEGSLNDRVIALLKPDVRAAVEKDRPHE